jgi:Trk-type K+ transport system membrane component
VCLSIACEVSELAQETFCQRVFLWRHRKLRDSATAWLQKNSFNTVPFLASSLISWAQTQERQLPLQTPLQHWK